MSTSTPRFTAMPSRHVSLRTRLVIVAVTVVGCLAWLGNLMLTQQIEASYRLLEHQQVQGTVTQLVRSFESQIDQVGQVTSEWAMWTELHEYVARPDPKMARDTLTRDGMANSKMDWMLVYDVRHRLAHQMSLHDVPEAVSAQVRQRLQQVWPRGDAPTTPPQCGMLRVEPATYIACRVAVRDSSGTAPARGTLVFMREVQRDMLGVIAAQTGVSFKLAAQPWDAQTGQTELTEVTSAALGHDRVRLREFDTQVLAQWRMTTLDGAQGPILEASTPRTVAVQGQALLYQVRVFFGVLAALALALLLATIHRLVVKRLGALARQLTHIETQRAWHERVDAPGHDEISTVAQRTNALLGVIEAQMGELAHHAATDALTALANRRHYDSHLAALMAADTPLTLVLVDVDHFKAYNDHYGHQSGDVALRTVGTLLAAVCRREGEMAARVGGEEFALLLPGSDSAQARRTIEDARQRLAARAIPHNGSQTGAHLTFSAGLAHWSQPGESAADLYARADRALYAAKQDGRNRTTIAHDERDATPT